MFELKSARRVNKVRNIFVIARLRLRVCEIQRSLCVEEMEKQEPPLNTMTWTKHRHGQNALAQQ